MMRRQDSKKKHTCAEGTWMRAGMAACKADGLTAKTPPMWVVTTPVDALTVWFLSRNKMAGAPSKGTVCAPTTAAPATADDAVVALAFFLPFLDVFAGFFSDFEPVVASSSDFFSDFDAFLPPFSPLSSSSSSSSSSLSRLRRRKLPGVVVVLVWLRSTS